MKQYSQLSVFCILLLTLLRVHYSRNASIHEKYKKFTGAQGLYNQQDDIEILTQENFKSAITGSNRAWLVEFYSSWCGFCQRFAPSWKEFGTDVRGWNDLVVVAALDCANDQNYGICRDYEVMSYPTLRYFHEGFQEEPKNYGFALNRGATASDHREDLVNKIISEQNEGRGKQFPNLDPYGSNSLDDIFNGASQDVNYAVLIIHEPGSLLGPEITLDLHKASNVITKYAYSNNTGLLLHLQQETLPTVYLIGRDKVPKLLTPHAHNRKELLQVLKAALKEKNVHIEIIEDDANKGKDEDVKKIGDDALRQRVKQMGDVVFQMDLESALRYSLKREVGGSKIITGEKLAALKKYLEVLVQYFPFGRNGKGLLQEIENYAKSNAEIEGKVIAKLVKNAESDGRQVFSTPQKWMGCEGSSPQFRRYPCGLWTMFHYLTVNVADYGVGLRGDNPRLALEAMHGYITHFFGCADCSEHFQEMATRRNIFQVSSLNDSIIWLWNAHNEVNTRLSGDATEDPDFPKVQFPSKRNCPKCSNSDGSWDVNEVLKYLKHMYSNVNVRYLGADTKVIYQGHEGEHSTAHERLQEEVVQIQTRPSGEGVTDRTDIDGSSKGTTIKDKAKLSFTVFFPVLTALFSIFWA